MLIAGDWQTNERLHLAVGCVPTSGRQMVLLPRAEAGPVAPGRGVGATPPAATLLLSAADPRSLVQVCALFPARLSNQYQYQEINCSKKRAEVEINSSKRSLCTSFYLDKVHFHKLAQYFRALFVWSTDSNDSGELANIPNCLAIVFFPLTTLREIPVFSNICGGRGYW